MKGLLMLAMSVAVVGCASEPAQPSEAEQPRSESPRMSEETKPAPGGDPTPPGPALLAAAIRSETGAIPAALNQGRFRIDGDCLQFVAAGTVYTPALLGAPRRTDGGFALGARTFSLDQTYVVSGGAVAGEDPMIEVSQDVRKSCSRKYYLIAAIERP